MTEDEFLPERILDCTGAEWDCVGGDSREDVSDVVTWLGSASVEVKISRRALDAAFLDPTWAELRGDQPASIESLQFWWSCLVEVDDDVPECCAVVYSKGRAPEEGYLIMRLCGKGFGGEE